MICGPFWERIRIDQRGRTLKWLDFCYSPERYSVLLDLVGKRKGKMLPHSVALVIDAESIEEYHPGGDPSKTGARLNGMHFPGTGPNRVRAQAFAKDPASLACAKVSMPHVIVGRPFVGGFGTGDDIGLRIGVHFPAQVAVVMETDPRPAKSP